ncbi:NnrU protein-domain-containing protein [Baffinella frigidus]|nr:NnrU protein-domain-containing protein [Cryptophyta sp. CCMP2293]
MEEALGGEVCLGGSRYSSLYHTLSLCAFRRPDTRSLAPFIWKIRAPLLTPTFFEQDAAVFAFSEQKLKSWAQFTGVFVTVFAALFVLWLNPSTGFGDEFAQAFINLGGGDSTVAMVSMLTFFGVAHSGLAGLRRTGEEAINSLLGTERVWRVFFGVVSLPLAFSTVVFFINHRYDGAQLWDVKLVPGVHEFCWVMSFISFWFLYPSTFNLLEVAAVDKPKVHMWETGIMRVTRHPQLVGQIIWCIPHTLYVGNSFMIWTSLALCAHHSFGAWHGDRRLQDRYGEAFEAVKSRTSVVPFAAIADGRQQLPEKWWTEYLRGPYAVHPRNPTHGGHVLLGPQ